MTAVGTRVLGTEPGPPERRAGCAGVACPKPSTLQLCLAEWAAVTALLSSVGRLFCALLPSQVGLGCVLHFPSSMQWLFLCRP